MKLANPRDIHGNSLLSEVTASGMISGAGTPEDPLVFAGITALSYDSSMVESSIAGIKEGPGIFISATSDGVVEIQADIMGDEETRSAVEQIVSAAAAGMVTSQILEEFASGFATEQDLSSAIESAVAISSQGIVSATAPLSTALSVVSGTVAGHVNNHDVHLPAGGEIDQVPTMTANGVQWKDVPAAGEIVFESGVVPMSAIPDLSSRYAAIDSQTGAISTSVIPDLSGQYAAVDRYTSQVSTSVIPDLSGQYVAVSAGNQPNGYLRLDAQARIPSELMPTAVDEIFTGYLDSSGDFLEIKDDDETAMTPQENAIYVDLDTNLTYRWGGAAGYVEISPTVALGDTSATAFPGDRGVTVESGLADLSSSFGEFRQSAESILGITSGAVGGYSVIYRKDQIDTRPYILVTPSPSEFPKDAWSAQCCNYAYVLYTGSDVNLDTNSTLAGATDTNRLEKSHIYAHPRYMDPIIDPANAVPKSEAARWRDFYDDMVSSANEATNAFDTSYTTLNGNRTISYHVEPSYDYVEVSGLTVVSEETDYESVVPVGADISMNNGIWIATIQSNADPLYPDMQVPAIVNIRHKNDPNREVHLNAGQHYIYGTFQCSVEGTSDYFSTGKGSTLSIEEFINFMGGSMSAIKHKGPVITTTNEIVVGVVPDPWIDITNGATGQDQSVPSGSSSTGAVFRLCLTVPETASPVSLVIDQSPNLAFSPFYRLDQRADQFLRNNMAYFNGREFVSASNDNSILPVMSGRIVTVDLSRWFRTGSSGYYRYKWVLADDEIGSDDMDWMGGFYPSDGGDSLWYLNSRVQVLEGNGDYHYDDDDPGQGESSSSSSSSPSPVTPTDGSSSSSDSSESSEEYQPEPKRYLVYGASGASQNTTANGIFTADPSLQGRDGSTVYTNGGGWYLAYCYDGDSEENCWALTTKEPDGSMNLNRPPSDCVYSNDSTTVPDSGWSTVGLSIAEFDGAVNRRYEVSDAYDQSMNGIYTLDTTHAGYQGALTYKNANGYYLAYAFNRDQDSTYWYISSSFMTDEFFGDYNINVVAASSDPSAPAESGWSFNVSVELLRPYLAVTGDFAGDYLLSDDSDDSTRSGVWVNTSNPNISIKANGTSKLGIYGVGGTSGSVTRQLVELADLEGLSNSPSEEFDGEKTYGGSHAITYYPGEYQGIVNDLPDNVSVTATGFSDNDMNGDYAKTSEIYNGTYTTGTYQSEVWTNGRYYLVKHGYQRLYEPVKVVWAVCQRANNDSFSPLRYSDSTGLVYGLVGTKNWYSDNTDTVTETTVFTL